MYIEATLFLGGFLFYVFGQVVGTGAWVNDSDERLKQNINTIDNALDKVLKQRGVSFKWEDPEREVLNLDFIAQEAKDVIPEVIFENNNYVKKITMLLKK